MAVTLYGSLADPAIKKELDRAQETPDKWCVYLVRMSNEPRTKAQNMLFQALLRKMAQQQGHSVTYWYEYFVERFLGFDEVTTEDGYTRKSLCSTSALTVTEFYQFLNACLVFASEQQVHLGPA